MSSVPNYSRIDGGIAPPAFELTTLDSEGVRTSDEGGQHKPEAMGTLGGRSLIDWITFITDCLLSLVPLFFIVIDIIAGSLNNKPTSPTGETIRQILLVLPTVFPITFAALMSKFFRSFALYRAERGVKLGELERLVGCQSLFAAVERQIATRRLSLFGAFIVLIWTLSPLGGQSSLRLVSKSPRSVSFNSTIRFLPREAAALSFMRGEDMSSEGWPLFAPLYMTALQTSKSPQTSPMDLFGNVKIPDFDALATKDTNPTQEWMKIDFSTDVPYVSLLGIPVAGVPTAGNASYSITSRHFAIGCFNVSYVANYTQYSMITTNSSQAPLWQSTSSFEISPSGISVNYSSAATQYFQLTSLINYVQGNTSVSIVNCSLSARDVDSSVVCENGACHVDAMRKSTTPVTGETPYGLAGQGFNLLQNTQDQLPYATIGYKSHAAEGGLVSSTMTEQWLVDPNTDFSNFMSFVNISSLDSRTLSSRLQMLYNTFWQTTYGPRYLTGNLSSELDYFDNAPMDTFTETPPNYSLKQDTISFNSSLAHVTKFDGEVYRFHWTYGVLLFVTSAVLLAAGVASLVLKTLTLAPDILGYASTSTRDNRFMQLDGSLSQPSYLDGLERARHLRDLQVMIGDVKPNSEVGQIAFTHMDGGSQRLRRGRGYM